MRVVLILASVISSAALAGERLSPPLSVEGARAALAQAGVRQGMTFNLGPYRYLVVRAAPTKRGTNTFALDIEIKQLPETEQ
jgi:hypothetical protein